MYSCVRWERANSAEKFAYVTGQFWVGEKSNRILRSLLHIQRVNVPTNWLTFNVEKPIQTDKNLQFLMTLPVCTVSRFFYICYARDTVDMTFFICASRIGDVACFLFLFHILLSWLVGDGTCKVQVFYHRHTLVTSLATNTCVGRVSPPAAEYSLAIIRQFWQPTFPCWIRAFLGKNGLFVTPPLEDCLTRPTGSSTQAGTGCIDLHLIDSSVGDFQALTWQCTKVKKTVLSHISNLPIWVESLMEVTQFTVTV